MSDYSTILFASPSFVEGVSRVVDLGNTLDQYNDCPSGQEADAYALSADWRAVGSDLRQAVREWKRENRAAVGS
ncbi:MAG: hypothetical protein EA424_04390 [Planctomycetaceae bacterium]|nr:MAG: hypothetical protein EA424_04390 [Planctomycetaceae bacterium]